MDVFFRRKNMSICRKSCADIEWWLSFFTRCSLYAYYLSALDSPMQCLHCISLRVNWRENRLWRKCSALSFLLHYLPVYFLRQECILVCIFRSGKKTHWRYILFARSHFSNKNSNFYCAPRMPKAPGLFMVVALQTWYDWVCANVCKKTAIKNHGTCLTRNGSNTWYFLVAWIKFL